MKVKIKHRATGAVLFAIEVDDKDPTPIRTALQRAVAADASLTDANLAGAYLADASLTGAYLAGANLEGANLADADLAGANLAGARNVPADIPAGSEPYKRLESDAARAARFRERHPDVPVIEHLDRKILERITTGGGVLQMSSWHTCETTHCRAGWAIHLAGEAGYKLEREHGAQRAGAMIYRASTGRVPHFFATTERALEDLKQCAAEQSGEVAP